MPVLLCGRAGLICSERSPPILCSTSNTSVSLQLQQSHDWFIPATRCLQWRTQFRKDMNRSEAQANNRAIDSLINYETVKYCGNEEHEVQRYDECMHTYQVGRLVH